MNFPSRRYNPSWIGAVLLLGFTGCDAIPVPNPAPPEAGPPTAPATKARVSLSPFPYDNTLEAVQKVTSLVQANADLYTVQLDNGIPWAEALSGGGFPADLRDQWKRHKDSMAPHHQVYVAIAPLAEDRTSWAESHGGAKAPSWAKVETRLTDEMMTAYEKYVLRVVEYFSPDYLNIGVEAGDMAAKLPKKWPHFDKLFHATASAVRAKYPNVRIGISTGLPFLQIDGVLARANSVFEKSDYVGISFYPYMSEFYERFGAPPLPAPPKQWREPLEWLRQNTTKPIAICETGYSSDGVHLPKHRLTLKGDPDNQARFTEDLAAIAQKDRYLFTVFFLAYDYDPLMAKLRPNDENQRLWRRTGFFGTNGAAKPAWASFQKAWLHDRPAQPALAKADSPAETSRAAPPASRKSPSAPNPTPGALAFSSVEDLFAAPSPDTVTLETQKDGPSFMRWKYSYKPGQFAWTTKSLPSGSATGARGLSVDVRSTRTDPLLLQIEESDGEAFYYVLKPVAAWTSSELPWSEFTVDATKKKNGVLDPARLSRILIADPLATSGGETKGSRTVDVTKLGFMRANRKE